eukprot:13167476-Alexandrium_andersonii.AAC.1
MQHLSTGLGDLRSTSSSGVTAPPSAMGEPATVSGRSWLDAQVGGTLIAQAVPLAGGAAPPVASPTRPPSPPVA